MDNNDFAFEEILKSEESRILQSAEFSKNMSETIEREARRYISHIDLKTEELNE